MDIRVEPVIQCPACGATGNARYRDLEDRAYFVPGRWTIFECSGCGGAWLNPAPVAEDLSRCYAGAYYTHEIFEPPTLGRTVKAAALRRLILSTRKGYDKLLPRSLAANLAGAILGRIPGVWSRACFGFEHMLPDFQENGRLLEIGCGDGRFVAVMKLLGWDVCAIEPDPAAAEVARKAARCFVHPGTVEDAPFESARFDVIVSSHVIEHVRDPRAFIAHAGRLLRPGGAITLLTPNYQSAGHHLLGRDWYCLDPPRHLCFFTPQSLHRLMIDSGMFRDVRTSTVCRAARTAVERAAAVRASGSFLAEAPSPAGSRLLSLAAGAAETAGNPFLRWGEEIRVVAVRSS